MLNQLTYKKRNILLAAGSLLFAGVIYLFAIKNTIELANQCSDMEAQLTMISDAPQRLLAVQAENLRLDQLLGNKNPLDQNMQNRLLEGIVNYCQTNNIELREFPEPLLYSKDGNIIETSIVSVESDFVKILGLVYELEKKMDSGKVTSVNYRTTKNKKTKRIELLADIYVQNIKKQEL